MWQTTPRPDAKRGWSSLRPLLPAIAVLLGGITISLFAADYVRQTNRRMDETWLRDHALQMEQVVTVRLDDFTDALVHTRAFFSAARTTDARVLHSYLQEVGIFAKYPGILAVGYVRRVPARSLSRFVRQMRKIYPGYHVWPAGVREDYYPLAFSDPPSADSRRALGYDSAVSPDRREAQLRAIRDDRPSATEKVFLARDRGKVGSPGFVLFLPVYRFGAPLATPAQRKRAVTGMLNTVFRTPDFIRGVIGETPLHSDISFDL